MNGNLYYDILWERNYEKGYANCRVAVDSDDNIVVCGIDKDYKGMVLKYDKDGNLLWADHALPEIYRRRILNFTELPTKNLEERFGGFLDIAIDRKNNIAVVGSFYDEKGEKCIVYVKKYDASGRKIWDKTFSLFDYNQSTGIGIDSSGNIFIVGYGGSTKPPRLRGFIAKFSSDGRVLWWRKVRKFGKIFTGYTSLVIDQNFIYAVGMTVGLRGYDLLLTKFRERWKIRDKIINRMVLPGKIIMDNEKNLIVVGQEEDGGYKHYISKISTQFEILWENKDMDGGLYDAVLFENKIAVTGKIMETKYYAGIFDSQGKKLIDMFLGNLISNGRDMNDWMRGIAIDSLGNLIIVGAAPVAKTIKVSIKEEIEEEHLQPTEEEKPKEKKTFMDILLEFFKRLFGT